MNGGGGTDSTKYVPHRKVKEFLGVSDSTVRRWAKDGRIEFITSNTGRRLYNLSKFFPKETVKTGQKVCYCRVSTQKQSQDLDNQVKMCQKQFPNHKIITDIGSGLNWHRKGFITLLDSIFQGDIQEVVVAHRDRLCRFGLELLSYIFNKHGVTLLVLDQTTEDPSTESVSDLISIVTVFTARYYGSRKYHYQDSKNKNQTKPATNPNL